MDWIATQTRLGGFYAGVIDGDPGPLTYAALFRAAGCRDAALASDMGRQAAKDFPRFGISANALRLAHFMAQSGHETGSFVYLVEVWGPTSAQHRYDVREDLGNTPARDGDGKRFRGRGIFQITGADNYRRLGRKVGHDLFAHPEKAADPALAVTLACIFWDERSINSIADRDDIVTVTRKINGGRNGLEDRKERLDAIRKVLGC